LDSTAGATDVPLPRLICFNLGALTTAAYRDLMLHVNIKQRTLQRCSWAYTHAGWLPGGRKDVITKTATTLAALDAATDVLATEGLISVAAYIGHEGALLWQLAAVGLDMTHVR